MDFSKLRVLVLDGGGKQTLAMIHGLKEVGCYVAVVCSNKFDVCYVSNKPDKKIFNPSYVSRNKATVGFILSLIATGDYDVLMPVGELGTNFVTANEQLFSQYVKLACAPRDVYLMAFNKQNTFDVAMEQGIPCPYTRHSKQDIEDYLEKAKFPIIIKPRKGLGSIGFHKFRDEEEFRSYLAKPDFNVDDYVVQEFVPFENRIGTNLFIDCNGNACSSYAVDVLRWFPVDAGAGVLIKTVDAPEILDYSKKLLKALGWRGFANIAFLIDKNTGEPKLCEINGRIPASVKMAYMCGFNVSKQMIQMIYDEPVEVYPENDKFGLYIRHLDTDMAWFFKSPNRFKATPSWFSWKNTQEVIFSKDDIKPFFYHFFQKFFNFNKIMKKKKH